MLLLLATLTVYTLTVCSAVTVCSTGCADLVNCASTMFFMHVFAAAQHTCSSRVHVLTNNKIRVRVAVQCTCTPQLQA